MMTDNMMTKASQFFSAQCPNWTIFFIASLLMPKIINNKRYDTADNASDDIHRIDTMMSRTAALICDDCQLFRSLKLLF